jgi:hypothetical protein
MRAKLRCFARRAGDDRTPLFRQQTDEKSSDMKTIANAACIEDTLETQPKTPTRRSRPPLLSEINYQDRRKPCQHKFPGIEPLQVLEFNHLKPIPLNLIHLFWFRIFLKRIASVAVGQNCPGESTEH